jgi:hypothetical protein
VTGAITTLAAGRVALTSGDISLTNTAFTGVTGATLTLATGNRRALASVIAAGRTSTPGNLCLDLAVDGTRVGQAFGLVFTDGDAAKDFNLGYSYLTDALSATGHTFTVQARVTGGTGTVYASTGVSPLVLSVVEQPT